MVSRLKATTSFVDIAILRFLFVREGVPRSPCALVSARPHPQAAARDRRDTVARRRALLPWRDCDGARQVTCAWLRAVHRSWSCSEPKAPTVKRPQRRTGHRGRFVSELPTGGPTGGRVCQPRFLHSDE